MQRVIEGSSLLSVPLDLGSTFLVGDKKKDLGLYELSTGTQFLPRSHYPFTPGDPPGSLVVSLITNSKSVTLPDRYDHCNGPSLCELKASTTIESSGFLCRRRVVDVSD